MTSGVSRLLALIQPAHKRLFYYSTDGLIRRKQTKLRLRLFDTGGMAGRRVPLGEYWVKNVRVRFFYTSTLDLSRLLTRLSISSLLCMSLAGVIPRALADDNMIYQAEAAAAKGNYDEAIQLYKRAQIDDVSAGAATASDKLVNLYVRLKRFDDATQLLNEQYTKTHDRRYQQALADTYRMAGNFYAAQQLYNELIATDPDDEASMYQCAQCLEATGNYDAAREMYQRVVEKGGSHASSASAQLARAKDESVVTTIDPDTEIGRWLKSRMPLKIYIEDGSSLAGYRSHLKNYVLQAIAEWQAVAHGMIKMEVVNTAPEKADIRIKWAEQIPKALGITYSQCDDDSGEISHVVMVLACNSDHRCRALPAESPATRALWESRDRMFREVALHEMGHALGLNHSPRSDDVMADGVYGLHSADVTFARSLQPGDIARITQLYSAPESAQGQTKKALVEALNKVVSEYQNKQGGGRNGTAGGAGRMQARAVKASSDPTMLAMQQAVFALNQNKSDECVVMLKDVLKQHPDNAQAHYLMAVALVHQRNYSEALKHYQQVLKIAPQGKLADLAHAGMAKIGK